MELRRFRYFVAVAEAKSFLAAARRLQVAQPALSKQVRDLEAELGVALFVRVARGVKLTPAGEALLPEARLTLEQVERAKAAARSAGQQREASLQFAHGELMMFAGRVADLLAAFRARYEEVHVSSLGEAELFAALRERRVDVAAAFTTVWPLDGLEGYRLVSVPATGVVLSASHPLAAKPVVHLADLKDLMMIHLGGSHWPQVYRTVQRALKLRGLVPAQLGDGSPESANVQIAAGDAWALANEMSAAAMAGATIVYRPFAEAPIPGWLVLLWLKDAPPLVHRLVEVAREQGLGADGEEEAAGE